ncbi:MAG: hypothetical protein DI619_01805 [Francisella sp.]|nr:MAG: hypothetical protein DI619_01805 [Francisella sp.]
MVKATKKLTPKGLSLILATWLRIALATYISIAQNHWQWGILLTFIPPILLSPILILLLYICFYFKNS